MKHSDHISLIMPAITQKGGVWADFGSGEGAFTLALRDIAGQNVEIYSIDKNESRLNVQKSLFTQQFPNTNIHYYNYDFTDDLILPKLDGVIMANSLHFVQDQAQCLKKVMSYLKKDGRVIVVEYNSDIGNVWVPFPISYRSLTKLAINVGYQNVQLMHKVPSEFLKEIYSAILFVK
jgi:ubiquinone/menaquinone biosynthesis C-methylase UbiE